MAKRFFSKKSFRARLAALTFITVEFEATKQITKYLLDIPKRFYKCTTPVYKAFLLFTSLKLLWKRYYFTFSFH